MNENAKIINVMTLFRHILKKWKVIVTLSIVFSMITVTYKYVAVKKSLDTFQDESDGEYINYNSELENINAAIYQKNEYLENSIFAKMDSTKVASGIVKLSISTDAMENPTIIEEGVGDNNSAIEYSYRAMSPELRKANRILEFYLTSFLYGMDWGTLPEELHTQPLYLNELVSVPNQKEELVSADLRVVYIDEPGAEKMIEQVQNYLLSLHDDAEQAFGSHSLLFTNQLVKTQAEPRFFTWINDRLVELNNLSTQKANFTNNMKAFVAPEMPSPDIRKDTILNTLVKNAIIGFILGGILSTIIYVIWLIASNRVLSGRDMNEQYKLNKIAMIPIAGNKQKTRINSNRYLLDGLYYSNSDAEVAWHIADENIINMCNNNSKIALVSDLGDDLLNNAKKLLDNAMESSKKNKTIDYRVIPDLNTNPESLSILEECDAVVLLAKVMDSNHNRINDLLETVRTYKKEIIGSIVLG